MFEKKIYALVDPTGLRKEPFAKGLSDYIMKTGGSIRPMLVDDYGNVMSVKFGDGTMSIEHIESVYVKYFEVVDPLDMAAIIVPTRPKPRTDRAMVPPNIIKFPPKLTIEPIIVGSYTGMVA